MKKDLTGILFSLFFCFLCFNSFGQWTQRADVGSINRALSVAFSIGTKGYIGLGENGYFGSATADIWEYDPSTNVWSQKTNYGGGARILAFGFSIGSKGYVGSGLDNNYGDKTDFWEFDPSANTWLQKANFTGNSRQSAASFSIGSKGYVGTGYSGTQALSEFLEYDPAANTWTPKANFGGGGRIWAVGFSIGSKGYIGTGETDIETGYKKDLWEYDPTLNSWSRKADLPGESRSAAAGFSVGSKGYIGTGNSNWLQTPFLNDFWEFDPTANNWTQKGGFPGNGRRLAVGFGIGSKGYVGIGEPTPPNLDPFSLADVKDFYEFDPSVTPTLTMGSLGANSFCSGTTISVPYSSSSGFSYSNGNVFTVQLSNSSGSFSSPTSIGTLTSTTSSGNISATIPNLSGYGYRIRVVSSNLPLVSNDNGVNLIFTQPYSTNYVGGWDYTVFTGSEQYLSTYWQFGYDFEWSVISSPGADSWVFDPGGTSTGTQSQVQFIAFQAGYYNVQLKVTGTCGTYYYYTSADVHNPWDFRYVVSPNPASTMVTVMPNPKNKDQKTLSLNSYITEVRIFDNSGNLKKQVKYGLGARQAQINVSDLKLGIYYIEISNGKEKERQKIMIQPN